MVRHFKSDSADDNLFTNAEMKNLDSIDTDVVEVDGLTMITVSGFYTGEALEMKDTAPLTLTTPTTPEDIRTYHGEMSVSTYDGENIDTSYWRVTYANGAYTFQDIDDLTSTYTPSMLDDKELVDMKIDIIYMHTNVPPQPLSQLNL